MTAIDDRRLSQSGKRDGQDRGGNASEGGLALVQAELVRSCGVALRRMGQGASSIAVTSTSRKEGRTTVAMGFAAAASAEGRDTILLDLDLLHRDVQREMHVRSGPGVHEVLGGSASVEECLQRADDRVVVVSAGDSWEEKPVIRTDRLVGLIEDLRNRSDVLIADLPPLDAGITAARMADVFDSVALVVRAGAVPLPLVEEAVSILGQRPYVILNRMGKPKSRVRRLFGR